LEERTDFTSETNSDFDSVVRGSLEEKDENLKSDQFMGNSLVDKVGNERGCGMTNSLK
jgi:hypothetical protein